MYKFVSSALLSMLFLVVSSGAGATSPDHTKAITLHGQVTFNGLAQSAAEQDYGNTIVFFQPDAPVKVEPMRDNITMATKGYAFVPHVLAVTTGTKVRFPNFDPIYHNVFSSSVPNNFDLGLYGRNPGKTDVFDHQGLVRVYCNVHHYMFAYILVLNTPYFTKVEGQGEFSLPDLPAGPGTLTIWNPQTKVWREHVNTIQQAALNVNLDVIKHGIPEHSNKNGKSYFHPHVGGV
ncbi:MAG: hypothetical protein ACRESU_11225 [Gammaproteobacteria bacterium]